MPIATVDDFRVFRGFRNRDWRRFEWGRFNDHGLGNSRVRVRVFFSVEGLKNG